MSKGRWPHVVEQVDAIHEQYADGASLRAIASDTGISVDTVGRIVGAGHRTSGYRSSRALASRPKLAERNRTLTEAKEQAEKSLREEL